MNEYTPTDLAENLWNLFIYAEHCIVSIYNSDLLCDTDAHSIYLHRYI